ncbi:hypothetical protein CCUS01_14680 [Colletotrichum cuscutae]|uniref:Uncharacterized protein n=1 Tax=Colletotrichum cuscutae TaxID=1209917 RepID=A0AAI9Y8R3_9PEZI|nr:hypothetical protein CCUS01_14680 [Colletotrichum cuscutae]
MFDASFLNGYHYFAATFSFNDGEFPDTITTMASGLDTLPEPQSLVNVETSGLMNVMHTATHHSLTSSNLATTYDTVGVLVSLLQGNWFEPWVNEEIN